MHCKSQECNSGNSKLAKYFKIKNYENLTKEQKYALNDLASNLEVHVASDQKENTEIEV